ncbi:GTPase [Enemella sp. A6]|uniref:GTPase n=1 Tax=Enemella sp. A6 TaxID=3440152 RepID=UPI003EC13AA6
MARTTSPSLPERTRALAEAADLSRGRAPDAAVEEAERVVAQADHRLAFSGEATVVALGGATGSGKSSLFNALTGTELSSVSMRRPTTSTTTAAVFGSEPTTDLLDWLDVRTRHQLSGDDPTLALPAPKRRLALPGRAGPPAPSLDGLVLLDLPDHDSTEAAHRLEVDRMVQLVDAVAWVLDPQKYADAALHENYLIPMARHAGVMLVVLNQIDRLSEAELERCLTDLRRLLDAEGLAEVEIHATSARTGAGVGELRARLAELVTAKAAAANRLAADVRAAADDLAGATAAGPQTELADTDRKRLIGALAEAARVPAVVDAVDSAWRQRGAQATGWPVLAWIGRFKPDPLRRLHLDRLRKGVGGAVERKEIDPSRVGRTSLPAASGVQSARVETAVREITRSSAEAMPRGWSMAVAQAGRSHLPELPDRLDRAVATTDLGMDRKHRWWSAVRVVQWLVLLTALVGLIWLGVAFLLLYLQMPPLPEVLWWGVPAPTVLAVGGVLAGLLLALFSRVGVVVGAKRAAHRARRALYLSIADVANDLVLMPIETELDRHRDAREAALRAAA